MMHLNREEITMSKITLETIHQVAREKRMGTLDAITMMQAGAAKIGDEDTLDRLCYIKEKYLELAQEVMFDLKSDHNLKNV
jgi:hypothetical protein